MATPNRTIEHLKSITPDRKPGQNRRASSLDRKQLAEATAAAEIDDRTNVRPFPPVEDLSGFSVGPLPAS